MEWRLGERVNENHSTLPWMIRHASFIINRFNVGQDGKTPYERWKQKKFKGELVEFGEKIMYLKMGSKGVNKMDCRWETGLWVGMKDDSNESITSTKGGCLKTRDAKRFGDLDDRWNLTFFKEVKGVPWEPIPGSKSVEVRARINVPK